jgi:hypothetical protein
MESVLNVLKGLVIPNEQSKSMLDDFGQKWKETLLGQPITEDRPRKRNIDKHLRKGVRIFIFYDVL